MLRRRRRRDRSESVTGGDDVECVDIAGTMARCGLSHYLITLRDTRNARHEVFLTVWEIGFGL